MPLLRSAWNRLKRQHPMGWMLAGSLLSHGLLRAAHFFIVTHTHFFIDQAVPWSRDAHIP